MIKFINARLYELKDTKYAEVINNWGMQSRKIDIQNPGYTSADCDGWKSELMDSNISVIQSIHQWDKKMRQALTLI